MNKTVVLLAGDGIGPEIAQSVQRIFSELKVPITFVSAPCGEEGLKKEGSVIPTSTVDLIRTHGTALKGPTMTPIGKGHRSANVTLRKDLDLYANVRPIFNLPGVKTPFSQVDLILVRENTEDVYMGVEHKISKDVAQCIKTITADGSRRVARFAFELAKKQNRKSVTCVHKANIMKLTDGLFLDCFYEISKGYPEIQAKDLLVDNACMQLVRKPAQFDVIVTENLYGDILSDLCAGLIGGLGVAGGSNNGDDIAVFEAVHGTAPDIAGKGLANPTALLLSSVMMLEFMGLNDHAARIRSALFRVLSEGRTLTRDLGGSATTEAFTDALLEATTRAQATG